MAKRVGDTSIFVDRIGNTITVNEWDTEILLSDNEARALIATLTEFLS